MTDRERLVRSLEADPAVETDARALDPAVVARLAAGVSRRVARRRVPAMGWGALAACAAVGLWVGWTTPRAAPAPTLLAAVQIAPIADPPP